MKITIDFPDPIFRGAKANAAHRGISLKAPITEAVESHIDHPRMTVSELMASLPRVDQETLEIIRQRVEESDRDNLNFQNQEERQNP